MKSTQLVLTFSFLLAVFSAYADQDSESVSFAKAAVFADIQKSVITPSCIGCHSGKRPSAGLDLSTYASTMKKRGVIIAKSPQGSSFYTEIATGKMPKRKPALSPALVTLVYEWIKNGALEK